MLSSESSELINSLNREIQRLDLQIEELRQDKKALIQDKERAYQDRDNWEQRYNLAQSEIRQLKNVQDLGDTQTLVG